MRTNSLGSRRSAQRADRLADQEAAGAGVDAHVVAFGRHPVDGRHGQADAAAALLDPDVAVEARGGSRLGPAAQVVQDLLQLLHALGGGAVGQRLAGAGERGRQPRGLDGLQQVIEGGPLEGVQREAVEGGDEDHDRARPRPKAVQQLKAGQARHLDVEQHDVGRELADHPRAPRRRPERGAHQLHLRLVAEQDLQPAARQRLVVDDQDAQDAHQLRSSGSSMVAAKPPPAPRARRSAARLAVEHRQPAAHVGQADAECGRRLGRCRGRRRRARSRARRSPRGLGDDLHGHRAGGARHAILHGVLDQRLQDQARDQRVPQVRRRWLRPAAGGRRTAPARWPGTGAGPPAPRPG